jgi:hypothetical protein
MPKDLIMLVLIVIFFLFYIYFKKKEYFNQLSFEGDIKPLFRQFDIDSMKSMGLDLENYEDVKNMSNEILKRVEKGDMPCDEPWSEDKIDIFRRWIEEGMKE